MWHHLTLVIPIVLATATAVSALGPAQSSRATFKEIERLAEAGHVAAQTYMGLAHDLGVGTPQNPEAAAGWYRMAADHGNPDAQLYLGTAYLKGRGVHQDYEKALLWLALASKGLQSEDSATCETLLNQVLWNATLGQLANAERALSAWQPKPADDSPVATLSAQSWSRRLRYQATLSNP